MVVILFFPRLLSLLCKMQGRGKKWEPMGQKQADDADLRKMIEEVNRGRDHPMSQKEQDQMRASQMREDAAKRILGMTKKARALKKSQPWLVANAQAGRKYAENIFENRMVSSYLEGRGVPQPKWSDLRTGESAEIVKDPVTGEETIVRKPGSTPGERFVKVDELVEKARHQAQIYAPVEHVEKGPEYLKDLMHQGLQGIPEYYNQNWKRSMDVVDANFRASQRNLVTEDPKAQKMLDKVGGGDYKGLLLGKHTLRSFREEREAQEREEQERREAREREAQERREARGRAQTLWEAGVAAATAQLDAEGAREEAVRLNAIRARIEAAGRGTTPIEMQRQMEGIWLELPRDVQIAFEQAERARVEAAAASGSRAADAGYPNPEQQRADIARMRAEGFALMPQDQLDEDFDFAGFSAQQRRRLAAVRKRLALERSLNPGAPGVGGKRRNASRGAHEEEEEDEDEDEEEEEDEEED